MTLHEPAELSAWEPALEALARDAVEPNVFHEHWMLRAAWEALRPDAVRLLLVQDARAVGPAQRVWAAFPVAVGRVHAALPLPVARLWCHAYSPLCTPLVRPGRELASLSALTAWTRAELGPTATLSLDFISNDGPIRRAVSQLGPRSRSPVWTVTDYERAVYRRVAERPPGLEHVLSKHKRHELRRQRRRLAERGELTVTHLSNSEDPSDFIEEFLALEASGWKRRSGTAMACDPQSAQFFRVMARQAHARGRLRGTSIRLDGRAIAQSVDLLTRDGGFAFKTAFDERWARYSVGVLLELEGLLDLQARPELAWLDSCAAPDHPVIGRLWLGRRAIASLVVGCGASPSDLLVASLPVLRWGKRRLGARRLLPWRFRRKA